MSSNAIKNCLQLLLIPVVRFCLRHSIKLQEIYEIIKYNLVILAKEELTKSNSEINASRITLITGVHRPDISRIESVGIKDQNQDQITKIIGKWQNDRKFTTPAGRPKTLEVIGKESEFTELVRSVNKDLNPYTILFELERIAAVERTSRGLKLIAKEYIPKGDFESGFALLARDLNNLINTVEDNVFKQLQPPHHHLTTEYDSIPEKFAPQISLWLQNAGAEFHKKIRDYLSKYDKDLNPKLEIDENTKFIKVAIGSNSIINKAEDEVDD